MIAADSSALLAIALMEPERNTFAHAIATNHCLIGAFTVLECHMVLRECVGAEGVEFIDGLLARPHVRLIAFEGELLPIARVAFDAMAKAVIAPA